MKVNNNSGSQNAKNLEQIKRAHKNHKAEQAEKAKANDNSEAAQSTSQTQQGATVDLSSEAKLAAKARQVAMEPMSVNQEKVDNIKAMIAAGNYKPDYGKVAEKVVNEQMLQEVL